MSRKLARRLEEELKPKLHNVVVTHDGAFWISAWRFASNRATLAAIWTFTRAVDLSIILDRCGKTLLQVDGMFKRTELYVRGIIAAAASDQFAVAARSKRVSITGAVDGSSADDAKSSMGAHGWSALGGRKKLEATKDDHTRGVGFPESWALGSTAFVARAFLRRCFGATEKSRGIPSTTVPCRSVPITKRSPSRQPTAPIVTGSTSHHNAPSFFPTSVASVAKRSPSPILFLLRLRETTRSLAYWILAPSRRVDRFGRASVCILALTAACGPVSLPTGPPLATHVRYGLNAGFHSPLPSDVISRYASWGGLVMVRTPQVSKQGLNEFMLAVAGLQIGTVALVEGPDVQLARDFSGFQSLGAIENGNELELPPHNLTPEQYADVEWQMCAAELAAGFTGDIFLGGVYALTDETKRAILLAHAKCPTALISVHLYTISREDIDWLNSTGVDIAITETGSPTRCGSWLPQATYQAQLRTAALQIRRLKYFLIYQGPTGPTCSDLDTFGIAGHPAEDLLQSWIGR